MALRRTFLVVLVTLQLGLAACSPPSKELPRSVPVPTPTPAPVTPPLGAENITLVQSVPIQVNVSDSENTTVTLSAATIEKANQFIISRVGYAFFSKYISINASGTRYVDSSQYFIEHPENAARYLQHPYYLMVYSLRMPEKPFVNGVIGFVVDIDGNVITEREPDGIPDGLKDTGELIFTIDEKKSIDIAKSAGLESGIGEWKTSFHWYAGDYKTYVWTVQNTLGPNGGKVVVIDANDGKVIRQLDWQIIVN